METNPIPEGFHTVTPYLTVKDAPNLINFLRNAFNATELRTTLLPDGSIANSEIKIGNSIIMLAEATKKDPPMPSAIYLYVPDTDTIYEQAVKAGAVSTMEPDDQFYGDRAACVKDPAGNTWWIATHIEDVANNELDKRAETFAQSSN